jgi:putative tryptophan/tyrosine transport system substrate-binding protein
MRRREFIALLGGATAVWPLAARAQQSDQLRHIAVLGDNHSVWDPWIAALVERLRQLGWIEDRTVAIEYRWSEGRPERVAEAAAEFVRQKPDVIVTYGGAVTILKRATTSIPIVFAIAVDPVGIGLVDSLSRPGGNVTGLSVQSTDLAGKRLELLRAIVPTLRRLAIVFDAGYRQPCWGTKRFRLRLARSALKSRRMRYGERRISHPYSTVSKAERTHFMSWKMLSLPQTVLKSRRSRSPRVYR